jgi:AcrR family transcriptional regulator
MLPRLAEAAVFARRARNASVDDIASALNASPATVYRFERGDAWPRDPDAMIAAYAKVLRVEPEMIWMLAHTGYTEHFVRERVAGGACPEGAT